MSTKPGPLRPIARVAFVLYALALVTATHWPGLVVNGPIDRTDLVIHAGVFCIWTCLFYLSWFVGGVCPKRRLVWTAVIALGYAALDEFTQPLPPFHRTFDWFDLLADSTGVLLGVGLIAAARSVWPHFRGDLG